MNLKILLKMLIERLANAGRNIAEKLMACRFNIKSRSARNTSTSRAKCRRYINTLNPIQKIAFWFVLFCVAVLYFQPL